MVDHMISMSHGVNGLQGYWMRVNGLQGPPQHGQHMLRTIPANHQMMQYGNPSLDAGMRQWPRISGQMGHHQVPNAMTFNNPNQQQQQCMGPVGTQQLTASMHFQKLNTQYRGHPLMGMRYRPVGTGVQQYREGPGQHPGMEHIPIPALTLNIMGTDLIDKEFLSSLVMELGLDRLRELPEVATAIHRVQTGSLKHSSNG
ncbi:PREDICTED: cbp/p300-interacting transactivator 3-like [Gekko japonicus]|uniref:Cbp/p300-interacting transactivator 3-like n=1 Tax=Gekko japonicus TaxID=146911 RepID=A0ABM1L2C8_GEKJA|nr:PREDICTED: cbp/p300-interacting transactivator 3-like [Gekko japonicus]